VEPQLVTFRALQRRPRPLGNSVGACGRIKPQRMEGAGWVLDDFEERGMILTVGATDSFANPTCQVALRALTHLPFVPSRCHWRRDFGAPAQCQMARLARL